MYRSVAIAGALASVASAGVVNVCLQQPFSSMLEFRDFSAATSYCAPHFPAQTIISTAAPTCLVTTSTVILGTSTVTATSTDSCATPHLEARQWGGWGGPPAWAEGGQGGFPGGRPPWGNGPPPWVGGENNAHPAGPPAVTASPVKPKKSSHRAKKCSKSSECSNGDKCYHDGKKWSHDNNGKYFVSGESKSSKKGSKKSRGHCVPPSQHAQGGQQQGGQPQGGQPQGGAPQGGQPQGGAPQGGQPQGGFPSGGQPQGGHPEGGQPQGGHPQGGQPQGGQPQGGAPPGYGGGSPPGYGGGSPPGYGGGSPPGYGGGSNPYPHPQPQPQPTHPGGYPWPTGGWGPTPPWGPPAHSTTSHSKSLPESTYPVPTWYKRDEGPKVSPVKRDAVPTKSAEWVAYQQDLVQCGYDCIQTACSCIAATTVEYHTPAPTCTEVKTKSTMIHTTTTIVVAAKDCDHSDLRKA